LAESLLYGRQLLRQAHDLPVLAAFALGGDFRRFHHGGIDCFENRTG